MTENRRVDLCGILACPDLRRELMGMTVRATQAVAGIEVTKEQAQQAYDAVTKAKKEMVELTAEGGRGLSRCQGQTCTIRTACARYVCPVDYRVWSAYQVCHLSLFLYLGHQYFVPLQSFELEHFPSLVLPL